MKELTHTCHYKLYAYDELCEADRKLVDAAKESTQSSYAPYSQFPGNYSETGHEKFPWNSFSLDKTLQRYKSPILTKLKENKQTKKSHQHAY